MDRRKVLLVEDALDVQMMVQAALLDDCDLTCVGSVAEAEKALASARFSLVLLDINLPDGDGFEFCKRLKSDAALGELPIFFLTGEDEINQRVLGFDLGADDYIVKPIEPKEFKARVVSRLKRKQPVSLTSFTQGDFRVDWPSQKAHLKSANGTEHELALTPIELKLLVQFLRYENRIFSRQELLTAVWGSTVYVSGHTIDTHISSLRKKVGAKGSHFKTIVKKGYAYAPQPSNLKKTA